MWRNQAALLNAKFGSYHDMEINRINCSVGVLKGFVQALVGQYPEIPEPAIQKYIKSRLEIRLKAVNRKLNEKRAKQRQKRSDRLYKIMQLQATKFNESNAEIRVTSRTQRTIQR
jgi:hypothetical protein